METKAGAKYLRITARKLRLIADVVRGQNAQKAETQLRFIQKHAARVMGKVLRNAIKNAENRGDIDISNLYIKTIYVNEGSTMKRWIPRARGSASKVFKENQPYQLGFGGTLIVGQKTHPIGFRLGYIKPWNSIWFADRDYAKLLHEDLRIKKFLKKQLYHAGVGRIEVERAANKVTVNVYTARPGIVIGKRGAGIDALKAEVQKHTKHQVFVNIREIRKAEMDATLVAENIATQLERRVAFRRAMKKAISSAMKLGALGVKVMCGGRLGGAEIARSERYMEGRVPLHTLRADIDYGTATGNTTFGTVGVKVWIFKGEVTPEQIKAQQQKVEAS